ncbi:MAG: prepilin peptidase [Gammaproteobacteria bacterium]|nr:MAG: prepilin peptidase [Gammaproteobacteria bacterium]
MGAALEALAASPGLLAAAGALLGLVVGSFLNVVAHRLPRMLERRWRRECRELLGLAEGNGQEAGEGAARYDLWAPPSHCPRCDHRLRAWENIPLLSYLLLRGRCRACGRPISLRYPLVELLSAALSAAVCWRFGLGWPAGAALLLTWGLLALSLIDLEHQLLPDDLSYPLLWAGLLGSLPGWFADPEAAILGAAGGYLSLWLVYVAHRWVTGREGMGHGDFKLLAVLGAWLGWQALPAVILASSVLGAAAGLALLATGRLQRGHPLPFGPFLAAAGWAVLLAGPDLGGLLPFA